MRALNFFLLLLIGAAAMVACLPVTDFQQTGTPLPATTASVPALSVLKQVSPNPPSPDPTVSYPYPYPAATPTIIPYPYPVGGAEVEVTWQLSEMEVFLETRAAEMMVPKLEGQMLVEALEFFEGTRMAARWQGLDEEELQYLTLAWETPFQLKPGESHTFSVGLIDCCYVFTEFDVQASWSISPTGGATLDPNTGFLTIDENTPHGTVYTVTADVENGRATPSIDVYVYTLEANPLVGFWKEDKQVTCMDGQDTEPESEIQELKFDADGTFSATWIPFEVYKDYWGTYKYEKATGELSMSIEDGNFVPDDFDGSGYAVVEGNNRLILQEIWLGRNSTNCGHIFVRY